MNLSLRNNKDFWAGLMFFLIGAGALFAARDYPFGSTLRMGPGYFPILLSGILMLFGIIVLLKGLRQSKQIQGHWSIRALILVPVSMVLFGIFMEMFGFLPAMTALIFVSAASGREFKFIEAVGMTIVLSLASWAIFIWGLGLPYPLLNKFW